jgi:hypothetical protein
MEGYKEIQTTPNIDTTVRKADDSWAKSDDEKAMAFADHLQQVFTPYHLLNPTDAEISAFLDVPCQMSLPIKPFSPKEVADALAQTNVSKAPGYDLISGKVLKELPKKAITLLTILYNSIRRLPYYPLQWKFAQIIMVNPSTMSLPIDLLASSPFPQRSSRNSC